MNEPSMLTELRLRNFKIFKNEVVFPFSKINLLTGINGKGKSSVLQSLLLLRQTLEQGDTSRIYLNGSCVSLGTFHDVRNVENRPTEPIFIGATWQDEDRHLALHLTEDPEDNRVLVINNEEEKERLHIFGIEHIHYVSADRLGPQDTYPKNNFGRFVHVGKIGEFTGYVLFNKREALVHQDLHIREKEIEGILIENIDATLSTQAGFWLSEILDTPNVKVLVEDLRADLVILLFKFGNQEREFKPANVGFGYSYILPIVVSGLIAQPGEILMVENPEAHLHPSAQSRLTHFLCKVAATGVQVFIESHSEHILNGLRVAAVKEDVPVKHSDIHVLYFQKQPEQPVVQIPINPDGGIDQWPDGFFDQTDKDFKILFGF